MIVNALFLLILQINIMLNVILKTNIELTFYFVYFVYFIKYKIYYLNLVHKSNETNFCLIIYNFFYISLVTYFVIYCKFVNFSKFVFFTVFLQLFIMKIRSTVKSGNCLNN